MHKSKASMQFFGALIIVISALIVIMKKPIK